MLLTEKSIHQPYLDVKPAGYSNNWFDKILPLVQQWHEYYGVTNHLLIGFKVGFTTGSQYLMLFSGSRTSDLDRSQITGDSTTILLNKHVN